MYRQRGNIVGYNVVWTSNRNRRHVTRYNDVWEAIERFGKQRNAQLVRRSDGIALMSKPAAVAQTVAAMRIGEVQ